MCSRTAGPIHNEDAFGHRNSKMRECATLTLRRKVKASIRVFVDLSVCDASSHMCSKDQ